MMKAFFIKTYLECLNTYQSLDLFYPKNRQSKKPTNIINVGFFAFLSQCTASDGETGYDNSLRPIWFTFLVKTYATGADTTAPTITAVQMCGISS